MVWIIAPARDGEGEARGPALQSTTTAEPHGLGEGVEWGAFRWFEASFRKGHLLSLTSTAPSAETIGFGTMETVGWRRALPSLKGRPKADSRHHQVRPSRGHECGDELARESLYVDDEEEDEGDEEEDEEAEG